MATTEQYLTQLQADKQALVNNLVEKGVEATNDETFTSLVPKVMDIQSSGDDSSGTSIEKGIIINSFDADGYATEVTIVGMTKIPNWYMYNAGYISGSNKTWFTGENAKINLPNNVTSIGENAFNSHKTLNKMDLPDTITSIGQSAFSGCSNYELDKLPDNLKSMQQYAFSGCTKLKITKIPSGITAISKSSVFSNCKGITELTFEGDITSFSGTSIFNGCNNLTKMSFPNNTGVPTINSTSISGASLELIEVPSALLDTWKTATYWSDYADIIVGI